MVSNITNNFALYEGKLAHCKTFLYTGSTKIMVTMRLVNHVIVTEINIIYVTSGGYPALLGYNTFPVPAHVPFPSPVLVPAPVPIFVSRSPPFFRFPSVSRLRNPIF
jgi:hypothetical protein